MNLGMLRVGNQTLDRSGTSAREEGTQGTRATSSLSTHSEPHQNTSVSLDLTEQCQTSGDHY